MDGPLSPLGSGFVKVGGLSNTRGLYEWRKCLFYSFEWDVFVIYCFTCKFGLYRG